MARVLPEGDERGRAALRAKKGRLNRLMDYEEMVRFEGRKISFEQWWGRRKAGLARKDAERTWDRLKVSLKKDGVPFTLEPSEEGGKRQIVFARETVLWFASAVPNLIERTIAYPSHRKYYFANRDVRLEEARRYYLANRDRVLKRGKEWREKNRARVKEYDRRKRERQANLRWQALLAAKGNACALCGNTYPAVVYDLHLPDDWRGRGGGRHMLKKGSEDTFKAMLEVVELRCANCNRLIDGQKNRPRR